MIESATTSQPVSPRQQLGEALAQRQGARLRLLLTEFCAGGKPADCVFAARQLRALDDAAARQLGLQPLKTFIARSVTIEPMLPFLQVEAARRGLLLKTEIGSYGGFIDELMNPDGALARYQPDLLFVIADLEDLAGGLDEAVAGGDPARMEEWRTRACGQVESLLRAVRGFSRARLVMQGFTLADHPVLGSLADAQFEQGQGASIQQLNGAVAQLCRTLGDAVFLDVDHLAARAGRAQWRDAAMFDQSRLAVAAAHFPAYAGGLARAAAALVTASKKVLCTDLDDTLWGGILGEDGPAGIHTGGAFPGNSFTRYQVYLRNLTRRGVLLAAVSKNNLSDVEEAFRVRAGDLALSLDDFTALKIGWQDKPSSLRELAEDLSLGLDSFVFVDDNPMECALMREQLPEVLTVQVSRDEPWLHASTVAGLGVFDLLRITSEDRVRGQEYQAQQKRAGLERQVGSKEEFLASLEMVCELLPVTGALMTRAVQLMAKTNQFNLTTRRYSAAELEEFAALPGALAVALRLRDRFGDSGVVGLALLKPWGEDCWIDSLLLSCRVIGRGVETMLLAQLAAHARRLGARRLLGEFRPTSKNKPCADFYPRHQFAEVPAPSGANPEGSVFYATGLDNGELPEPGWIVLKES